MTQLRFGIVGAGKVSDMHAEAVRSLPDAELVAVCSRPSAKRERFAAQWGVPGFDDIDTMVDRARVQAVLVCTPHPAHREPTVAALRRGVHAMVEKPLASSLADCDAMIDAARQGRAQLGTISQRRYYPPCVRVREAIERGKMGKPILGVATILGWRDEQYYRSDPWRGSWTGEGGGILVNQAPHQLDLLLWFMGAVDEVFGYWGNLNHPYIEVDDTAVAVIRFKNGGLGNVLVSNSQNPALHGRVSVHGSNGASLGVRTDGGPMFVPGVTPVGEAPYNDMWTVAGEEGLAARWKEEDAELFRRINPLVHFHRLQIADFVAAIRDGRPPAVTAQDGRRVVELFSAIYRTTATGRPAKFPLRGQ